MPAHTGRTSLKDTILQGLKKILYDMIGNESTTYVDGKISFAFLGRFFFEYNLEARA